jgi:PAS domain S-box-containing protein
MSLKARLRIAIVALVTLLVIGMSVLYLYDFTGLTFTAASKRADLVADDVKGNLLDRLDREIAARGIRSGSLQEWKDNWTRLIGTDPSIADMLKRSLGNDDLLLGILVSDDQGKVLAASSPNLLHSTFKSAEDFRDLQAGNWIVNLWDLMTRREDYTTLRPLGVDKQPLFNIAVIIRPVFLRHEVLPALQVLALTIGSSLFIAVFLGSVLPNVILDPLQRVSRSIDLIRTGQFDTAALPLRRESSEFAAVQSKLSLLGQQFRGAKQDALEFRSNVEHLLERLEEAVLLFDNSGRLMMAGETAERMLAKSREQLIGRALEELFPASTVLGNVIVNAVRMKESVHNQSVTIPPEAGGAQHLLVSVEILRRAPSQENIGTLITLRDVESRQQLEVQLGISSRLAAISRLTSGVAHEIKNPLNAMALHLEVLKSKLDVQEPELDVIAREIKRLDNVVKTFLNFNKPVVLQARPIDLNRVVEQVLALVLVEAQTRHVELESGLHGKLWINGDPDLLKQAILNVVNNGLEAMPEGGKLAVRTEWDGNECGLTISDAGSGIPPEIQDRIFNLYFTTKEHGSGIGLATTFRVVQLHSGTIDFVSEQGKGTTFRLRFPGMMDYQGEALTSATGIS